MHDRQRVSNLPEHDLNDATMKLLRSPPFKAGQPINHSSYDNYKKDLLVKGQEQRKVWRGGCWELLALVFSWRLGPKCS